MSYSTGGRRPNRGQLQLEGGLEAPATLAGALQLDDLSANVLALDGGLADRAVKMPASNRNGAIFWISNAGATNALDLQTSAGVAISGATASLAIGKAAQVGCVDGVWRHFGIYSITL